MTKQIIIAFVQRKMDCLECSFLRDVELAVSVKQPSEAKQRASLMS